MTTIVPAHVFEAARAAAAAQPPSAPPAPSTEGTPSTVQPMPPSAPVDYLAEATDCIEFAYDMFSPLYPSLQPIYTADVRERIAQRAAPLMEKYGVTLGVLGPELSFLITVAPLIIPTVKAIRHDQAQIRAAQQSGTETPPPAPIGAAAAPGAGAGGNVVNIRSNANGAGRDIDRFSHGFRST